MTGHVEPEHEQEERRLAVELLVVVAKTEQGHDVLDWRPLSEWRTVEGNTAPPPPPPPPPRWLWRRLLRRGYR
jgi:hypothetical protein